jgi:hypothetical protein
VKKYLIYSILFGLLCSLTNPAIGQISKRDLRGLWEINNGDNRYSNSDTLDLYQDHIQFQSRGICNTILWFNEMNNFKIGKKGSCDENEQVKFSNLSTFLKMNSTDFGQILTIKRKNQEKEQFKILDFK